MSIIHDALKKVQQGLASKKDETQASPPTTMPDSSGPIWNSPPAAPETPPSPVIDEKPLPEKNHIQSLLAMAIAFAITVGALFYIYQQCKTGVPKLEGLAKSTFYKLMNKKEEPTFKTKAPEELKPLAKITINAPVNTSFGTTTPPPPVTLNIHGIMSNAGSNVVLINDSVYQEGDEVEGAKIVKINLDSITVIDNGIEKTIPVRN